MCPAYCWQGTNTCESHGTSRAAFVCQRLDKDAYTGFHEGFESNPLIEPDDDYQAWCDECERMRKQEGEWNDVSEGFAKIRLICDQCFSRLKGEIQLVKESDLSVIKNGYSVDRGKEQQPSVRKTPIAKGSRPQRSSGSTISSADSDFEI